MERVLTDHLVEEFLVRLALDDPVSLLRAAAVCRQWCRIVSAPTFRRRFAERRHRRALDTRHGRVLLTTMPWGPHFEVWDPVMGDLQMLPLLPLRSPFSWNAAVVCAAHSSCTHLDCSGGPFLVVFLKSDRLTRSSWPCAQRSAGKLAAHLLLRYWRDRRWGARPSVVDSVPVELDPAMGTSTPPAAEAAPGHPAARRPSEAEELERMRRRRGPAAALVPPMGQRGGALHGSSDPLRPLSPPFVTPFALLLLWNKDNAAGSMLGAVVVRASGVAVWFTVAKVEYGHVDLDTIGECADVGRDGRAEVRD